MICVLIKVYGGIVDDVVFFEDQHLAAKDLEAFVKNMNYQDEDAYLVGPDGVIANAKTFLDENDTFMEGVDIPILRRNDASLYIIVNPHHPLGFMVTSPDDAIAFKNPVEALSELGQMRKDLGSHLNLYRVLPVNGLVVERKCLEQYNADCDIDDFDYSLVSEYVSVIT